LAFVGDELVLSGGPVEEVDPLLDSEFLYLSSIPAACGGPYWVITVPYRLNNSPVIAG
jgi:hypothetical protein